MTTGYRSDFVQKLKDTTEPEQIKLSEWKLAVYGLWFSLSVICAKVFYANRNALHDILFEDKLLSYETIEANGQVMFHYMWTTVLRSSNIFLPLFCGIAMTAFTWLMVYLDSAVPGVQPPSPFSPSKYKFCVFALNVKVLSADVWNAYRVRSGHTFHLGYVIAVVNGLLVFTLMLVNGIL